MQKKKMYTSTARYSDYRDYMKDRRKKKGRGKYWEGTKRNREGRVEA